MKLTLKELISKRNEYRENCTRILAESIFSGTGSYCKGTVDLFVCWPHSAPGNVSVPCPSYLPWITEDDSRSVYRQCLSNGSWRLQDNSTEAWRDQRECVEPHYFKAEEDEVFRQGALRVISIVGYSLSLSSLSLATLLMGILRRLCYMSCTPIYPATTPGGTHTPAQWYSSPIAVVCKASRMSMEYFVACNYFWLLVEAIFLHTLLFTAIIFYIFIKILLLLLSKLKADQVRFTDYRYSLARATLVLIPLLGIHEVVFTFLVDECVDGSSRYARNFINLTLSSFQGFLVSVLYCFSNGEAELKKHWQQFLFTNHFQVTPCIDFRGAPIKHLWKCSRGQRPHGSQQSESYEKGGGHATHSHLLQVAWQGEGGGGVEGGEVAGGIGRGREMGGLEFHTRKSLSSSDGEMTLGETVEEIVAESEF
ncbi:unnamed protein product [Coregonus sp. 'balchen']|nr:unnamed protein product [Coregonus sp. 'balchen']